MFINYNLYYWLMMIMMTMTTTTKPMLTVRRWCPLWCIFRSFKIELNQSSADSCVDKAQGKSHTRKKKSRLLIINTSINRNDKIKTKNSYCIKIEKATTSVSRVFFSFWTILFKVKYNTAANVCLYLYSYYMRVIALCNI